MSLYRQGLLYFEKKLLSDFTYRNTYSLPHYQNPFFFSSTFHFSVSGI